jgi:hypothetical protein
MKMDNLIRKLQMNLDHVTKIRPIADQELGCLEEIRGNPALSQQEKLTRAALARCTIFSLYEEVSEC